jgi:hypothetical protein
VGGRPLSDNTERVLALWHDKKLDTSIIAERVGIRVVRVNQILWEAKRRGDPRAGRKSRAVPLATP